ncbi:hypothetical protein KC799_23550 [candidate division KSB1 bacterium]|nr:hypothetical protein [candidate division KSB1 bacterium]
MKNYFLLVVQLFFLVSGTVNSQSNEHIFATEGHNSWGTYVGDIGGGRWSGVNAIHLDKNNRLYVGGDFSVAKGVAVYNITYREGDNWHAISGAISDQVFALGTDENAHLYIGGYFQKIGTLNVGRIAKWDGATWSALGTGLNGYCKSIAVSSSTKVYAGGTFTTAGGKNANHVAVWNGTSWENLGDGLSGTCRVLKLDATGNLYAGGSFVTAGGVTVNNIAKWNGTTWEALGTGLNGTCLAMDFDENNNLYVGGSFTTAGGQTANRTAMWNGSTWSALGVGLNDECKAIKCDQMGSVYAGGDFTYASGVSCHDVAQWKIGQQKWVKLSTGIRSPTSDLGLGDSRPYIDAIALDKDQNIVVGGHFKQVGAISSLNIAKWGLRNFTTEIRTLKSYPETTTFNTKIYLEIKDDIFDNITVKRQPGGKGALQEDGVIARNVKGIWEVPVNLKDIITFEINHSGTAPTYIPSIDIQDRKKRVYTIKPVIQWKDYKSGKNLIPNFTASINSFDIIKTLPAHIDKSVPEGGGLCKQIFKDLSDSDIDHTKDRFGDYVMKNQFAYSGTNVAYGEVKNKSVFGTQNFRNTFSVGIEPEISIGSSSMSGKFGYSNEAEQNFSRSQVFTFSRMFYDTYNLALVKEDADLSDNFINAVKGLNPITQYYSTYNNIPSNIQTKLTTFIQNWGTHFPLQVHYGGLFLEYQTTNFSSFARSKSSSYQVVRAEASQYSLDQSAIETGEKKVLLRGGTGNTFESFSASDGNAQPVKITLSYLYNLLYIEHFEKSSINTLTQKDLYFIRNALRLAIDNYIQSAPKRPEGESIEIYELNLDKVRVLRCDDDGAGDDEVELDGWVEAGFGNTPVTSFVREWSGNDKEAGNCNNPNRGVSEFSINKKLLFPISYNGNNAVERRNKGFALKTWFEEDDYWGDDHIHDPTSKSITLEDIYNSNGQTKRLDLEINDGSRTLVAERGKFGGTIGATATPDKTVSVPKWHIKVLASVRKVPPTEFGVEDETLITQMVANDNSEVNHMAAQYTLTPYSSPIFDEDYVRTSQYYATVNGENPAHFWRTTGLTRGYQSSPAFDVSFYLNENPPVKNGIASSDYLGAVNHFIQHGLSEGLQSSPIFSVDYFLNLPANKHIRDKIFADHSSSIDRKIAAMNYFNANYLRESLKAAP